MDTTTTPRQKRIPVDTDIESDNNAGLYTKTPVALQKKKKTAPPVESSNSEGQESVSEVALILKVMVGKKRSTGRSDSATLVRKIID